MSKNDLTIIRGAGGKDGGSGGGLNENPDTMRSVAYAHILDLISEGEIEGFPTTSTNPLTLLQYVFFDGTPVANADGSLNFKGAKFDFRPGTQGQTHISGFPDSESEIAVGVEVKNSAAVVRTITDATVDAARVTLRVNSFYQLKSDGSMSGADVEYKIDVQSNGGGYVNVVDRHIKGKSSGEYQRAHRIQLTDYGPAPWDIRVSRVTQDNDGNTAIQDALFWDSYTQIVDAKFRFPNSALAAIKIDSSQFGHIPTRGYDLKLLKVQIPSNYDPATRTYTGVWDGTFTVAWTDNPAWVYYDLVTNERYGLGKYIGTDVDKWALYTIGQYCDVLVDDGQGGQEPRFTCNAYFQKRIDAYTFLQHLASVFRGMAYWGAGQLTAVQDAPSDPVALYTNANVIEGRFTYAGASRRARHTVALVQWNNPDNLYKSEVEYVPDRTGIARYGIVETEVVAVGCTSRGQAHRLGKWILYSERLETETCAWRTGLEGIKARPGQIVEVADQNRAGTRRGGRIKAATTSQITLDDNVTIDPNYAYTLYVVSPGGAVSQGAVQLPAQAETTNVVTLQAALAAAPAPGSIWILSGTDVAAATWRVVGVTEPEKNVYEITAVAHDPNKYAEIEQNIILEAPPTTTLNSVPAAPASLNLTQHAQVSASTVALMIGASWTPVVGAQRYLVSYQVDGGNVVRLVSTEVPHVDIPVGAVGTYTVTVRAVNGVGRRSPSIDASAYYDGTSIITLAQPILSAQGAGDAIDLSWNAVANADSYTVEWSPSGSAGTWSTIATDIKTLHWRDLVSLGASYYYRVTAYDHFGAASSPSASVLATADKGGVDPSFLDTARPIQLWRPTGGVAVSADDLSKHSEILNHLGGLGIPMADFGTQISGRTTDKMTEGGNNYFLLSAMQKQIAQRSLGGNELYNWRFESTDFWENPDSNAVSNQPTVANSKYTVTFTPPASGTAYPGIQQCDERGNLRMFPVKPGSIVLTGTGIQRTAGSSTNFGSLIDVYDASGTKLGTEYPANVTLDGTQQAGSGIWVAPSTVGTGVPAFISFRYRAALASTDTALTLVFSAPRVAFDHQTLTDPGGARLGGQMNNVPLVAGGNYTTYWSTPPTYSFSGSSGNWTVTVSQGVARIGSQSLTVDGWTLTALPNSTTFYAAVIIDPWPSNNHLTSPQIIHSTNQNNVNNDDRYLSEGSFTTPSSTGTGGGGGGFNCVTARMWLGVERLAKYAEHGWRVNLAEGFQELGEGLVDNVVFTTEPCIRLTLSNGWYWEGTPATPWDLQDGSQTTAGEMQGQTVLLKGGATATVAKIEDIGLQKVARVSVGGRSFAAGDSPDHLIYSHNTLKP